MAAKAKAKSKAPSKTKSGVNWRSLQSGLLSLKQKKASVPPKGAPTLAESKADRYSVWVYIVLAFFIPFILMFTAFKASGVSPFGNNQILATDAWHQYYPFLVDFQDKLKNGGSLLWTWKSGGGVNYVALMSYYLASPLNFLSVLVPVSKLREFLYIITCVKIGFAGAFYALFLKITFKRRDASLTAFGIMYALCAFIMGYYWNVIWLDTIALLPLVIAGAIALLKDGKFKLYILSLALSILANYYIGLFTCIFVFLVALGYSFVEYKGWKDLIVNFLKMAGCSLVGVMMSAALTLPAYFALLYTHSSDNTFPENFAVNIGSSPNFAGVLEGIGKTVANSIAFTEPTAKEGLPNVYCGVFTILLAMMFFFTPKIKKRERLFCGVLQLFFILSFIIRQLDYVWHGFHFPNMLPYRFSFLYSFVLIYMAFRAFMYIDDMKPAAFIGGLSAFILYMGVVKTYFDGTIVKVVKLFEGVTAPEGTEPDVLYPDPVRLSCYFVGILAAWILVYILRDRIHKIAFIISSSVVGVAAGVLVLKSQDIINTVFNAQNAQVTEVAEEDTNFAVIIAVVIFLLTIGAAVVMSFDKLNHHHQMAKVVLSTVLLLIALIEGAFSAAGGVKTVGVTDGTYYPLGGDDTLACVATINDLEEDVADLPRAEVNKYYSLNDNALIGINGISMFNSLANKDITSYMEKLGICGWVESNRYTYQESSPFVNMMLNVKYIIAPYGAYLDETHNESIYQSGSVRLMQNKYYLPQGFMVDSSLSDYRVEFAMSNPMENQNSLFRLATGLSGNIHEFLQCTSAAGTNQSTTVDASNFGYFTYSSTTGNESYDITYTAPRTGVATAYLSGSTENVSIRVNNAERISYYIKRPFNMMIGSVNQGDTITLHFTANNSSNGTMTAYCAMFNDTLFEQGYNLLSQSALQADEVTDTRISGEINAAQDGLFYTSISSAKGWKAYVDGEEVEITPVGSAMLAFPLSKGSHQIELTYTPEGFVAGMACSIFALLIFIALCFIVPRREKLFAGVGKKFLTTVASKTTKISASAKSVKSSKKETSAKDAPAPEDAKTPSADDNDNKTILADDDPKS